MYAGMSEDEAVDHYAELLAFTSGHFCTAVRAKDARAAGVWLRRCLDIDPPDGYDPGLMLLLLLAAQVPASGDARRRVQWLRDFGAALGEVPAA
jgi:hypothetical protein